MKGNSKIVVYTLYVILGILILLVVLAAFNSGKLKMNTDKDTAQKPNEEVLNPSGGKFSETAYQGELKQILEDKSIIVLVDNEEYEYILNERSLNDLKTLDINVGDQIVVNFEKNGDGTYLATSLEKVQQSL